MYCEDELSAPLHTHTHARLPAVHHGRSGVGAAVHVVSDGPDELDQGLGGLWDSVVGPDGVVEVSQASGGQTDALLWGDHRSVTPT